MSKNQTLLFKNSTKSYGGVLLNTRKGRQSGTPLATKNTMHLILRSSKAIGDLSFKKQKHSQNIKRIISQFSAKYGIKIISFANVGNHLHMHLKLSKLQGYKPFIRAVTAAIAMSVTGLNRWNKNTKKEKFWDYRPFTRVIIGLRALLIMKDYLEINQLEGLGLPRKNARFLILKNTQLLCS